MLYLLLLIPFIGILAIFFWRDLKVVKYVKVPSREEITHKSSKELVQMLEDGNVEIHKDNTRIGNSCEDQQLNTDQINTAVGFTYKEEKTDG